MSDDSWIGSRVETDLVRREAYWLLVRVSDPVLYLNAHASTSISLKMFFRLFGSVWIRYRR